MTFKKEYGVRWNKGMMAVCPSCGAYDIRCYDTMSDDTGIYRKRLRKCLECDYRWSTIEMPMPTAEDLLGYKVMYERLKDKVKELNDGAKDDRQGRTAQGDRRGGTGCTESLQVLSEADVSDSGLPCGGAR